MLKNHRKSRIVVATGLVILVLSQSCRMRAAVAPQAPADQGGVTTMEEQVEQVAAPTRRIDTPTPVPTQVSVTATPLGKVTISAVKGNLFIRRGPDLAFDSIAVLYEGSVAEVTARDVLSQWAQIVIPSSAEMGWVSLQTRYSEVQGNLQALPDFTPTDWPVAAYLRNCTYHQMLVSPGDIVIPSLLEYPENEVWIYPGSYTVHDLDHPDVPDVASVQMREGLSIDIREDGNGEKRKCP